MNGAESLKMPEAHALHSEGLDSISMLPGLLSERDS